jgi:hypothetical protein
VPKQLPAIPVRFYRTAASREPLLHSLRSLGKEDRRKIGTDVMRWPIGMRLVWSRKDGLWKSGLTFEARYAECSWRSRDREPARQAGAEDRDAESALQQSNTGTFIYEAFCRRSTLLYVVCLFNKNSGSGLEASGS